jgi:vacuolar-type H+-ATPase subunit I/STV1
MMDELTKLVIDKVLLGFVVAAVGYFFAVQLESRKKKFSLLEELSKKRAESIISVYSSINNYESKVQAFMSLVVTGNTRNSNAAEVAENLNSAHESIVKEADSNRFLLGEDLYKDSIELTNLIYGKLHLLAENDDIGLKEADKKIEKIRIKVHKCLPELYQS